MMKTMLNEKGRMHQIYDGIGVEMDGCLTLEESWVGTLGRAEKFH